MKFGLPRVITRLLGHDPAAPAPAPVPAVAAAPAAVAPPRPQGYAVSGDMPILHRREIVDDRKRLCGYHFAVSYLQPGRAVSDSLYWEVLHSAGIPGFAARRVAVVPVEPSRMARERYIVFNGRHAYLLVDARRSPSDKDQLADQLAALQKAGLHIALTGVGMTRAEMPLLEHAGMIFLVLDEYPLEQFQKLMRHLRALFPEVAIVVEGIDSWAEYRMCVAWGAKFCLGDFMTTMDAEESRGDIDHSHLVSIEMLNLLRSDGELEQLAEIAKKDPGITYKLLGWANSPANGLATTVTSLAQAIVILGRAELYRYLTVSMFRMGRQQERNESVLEIALARARLLECMPLEGLAKKKRDELFLVGLFSLFDVLMEVPLAQVLDKVALAPDVDDALRAHQGPYAALLEIAVLLERGRDQQAADKAAAAGIDFGKLQAAANEAFAWAQKALGGGR